jgi:uncharacterized membrane protein YfcA
MTSFDAVVLGAATVAGAVASVTGFGIGSLLTPTLAPVLGTKIAVALVAIPHAIGTAIRFWMLRAAIDRHVLWRFGLTSAAGGLAGALLHSTAGGRVLGVIFGTLLLFVAASEFSGLSRRLRFHGSVAWIAGALSGLLGGLVGNQGGIRSAALLGFELPRRQFVATATATGLIVDAARLPVYLSTTGRELIAAWPLVSLATAGVIVGTLAGARLLRRIPEPWFRRIVAVVLGLLGATTIAITIT